MQGTRSSRYIGFGARRAFRALWAIPIVAVTACDRPLSPELALVLSQASVEFRATRGSTTPLTQTIAVSNAGGGRLGPVTCLDAPAAWLTCSVSGGNLVTLTANPAGLVESPPPAAVQLTAPGASGATTLDVALSIEQPQLTLDVSTVSFFAAEGAATTDPGSRTVVVTNTGVGGLAGLGAITCAAAPPNTRVGCTVGATGALTVTVNPSGLAPGTYIYPVSVSAQNSPVAQTFSIALTVGARPRIGLSVQSLHFQMVRGATATQAQTVTVTNIGTGSLGAVTCSSPVAWLTCSVAEGIVTVTANASGLLATPAAANVNVSAANAINSPQAIVVTLGLDQPVPGLSADTVSFARVEGGTVVVPATRVVTVTNVGAGTADSLGEITCTPPVDSPVVCTVEGAQVTLSITPTTLTPGVRIYSVAISAANSAISRNLSVVYTVTPPITASRSAVHFTAIRGTPGPLSEVVTITLPTGGPLGILSCPVAPAAWLSCVAGATTVTFNVEPAGLTASPSAVVVPVTAEHGTLGNQGTASISVSLSIEQPVLTVNPASVEITGAGAQNVQAGNAGAGNIGNLGTIACTAAANVACAVNQATGVLTITTNTAGLASGTYLRTLTVTAANASNSQAVTVVLTVP